MRILLSRRINITISERRVELENIITIRKHINKDVGKTNNKLFIILKLQKCSSKRTIGLLCKQLAHPYLEYLVFLIAR